MAAKILLKEIATLMTSDHFKNNVSGVILSNAIRRIEYPVKLDVTQRCPSRVVKGVTVKSNSIIVIPLKDEDVFYVTSILDSLYVKGGILAWSASVRKLANIPIVDLIAEDKEYFSILEKMLLATSIMGEQHISYEYFYAAERLLADIRDSMIFELYAPELMHAENIQMIEHWKQEVETIKEKHIERGFDELMALINSLLSPNNMLYDNLKRYYLLVEKSNR